MEIGQYAFCLSTHPPATPLPHPSIAAANPACWRSANFWIFLVLLFGNSPDTTVRGALKPALQGEAHAEFGRSAEPDDLRNSGNPATFGAAIRPH
jgi:hypothetical protein